MSLMEEIKKIGLIVPKSMMDELKRRAPARGEKTLVVNAAIAWFLLAADKAERDMWMGLVERARRGDQSLPMLDRLRGLVTAPVPLAEAADGHQSPTPEGSFALVDQVLSETKGRLRRRGKSSPPASARRDSDQRKGRVG